VATSTGSPGDRTSRIAAETFATVNSSSSAGRVVPTASEYEYVPLASSVLGQLGVAHHYCLSQVEQGALHLAAHVGRDRYRAGESRPFSLARRWLICRKTITAR
jgi:hypothetical protein